jgi:hypothetical protein
LKGADPPGKAVSADEEVRGLVLLLPLEVEGRLSVGGTVSKFRPSASASEVVAAMLPVVEFYRKQVEPDVIL